MWRTCSGAWKNFAGVVFCHRVVEKGLWKPVKFSSVGVLFHQLGRAWALSDYFLHTGENHLYMVQEHYILELETQVEDIMRFWLN